MSKKAIKGILSAQSDEISKVIRADAGLELSQEFPRSSGEIYFDVIPDEPDQDYGDFIAYPLKYDKYPNSASMLPSALINLFISHCYRNGWGEKNLEEDLVLLLKGVERWDPFTIELLVDDNAEFGITGTKVSARHALKDFIDAVSTFSDEVRFKKSDEGYSISCTHPMQLFRMVREAIIGMRFETLDSSLIDLTDLLEKKFETMENRPLNLTEIEKDFGQTKNIGRMSFEYISRYAELYEDYRAALSSNDEREMDNRELLIYMPHRQMASVKEAMTCAAAYREGAGHGMINLVNLENGIARDLKTEIRTELAMATPQ